MGRLATVRLLQRRRRIDCDELDGKSDVAQVEDEGARAWIDVARAAPVVPVEAGRDPNDQPLGRGRADASSDDRLRRCHEVGDLHGGACDLGRRAQDGRSVEIGLLPRARCVVEPERLVLPLESQPELAEVLPVVDVRPEDPLDLAALADRDEDRAVAGDRRRAECEPAAAPVERSRDVGRGRHQRGVAERTDDVVIEPSLARITATSEMRSPLRYLRGSM